MEGPRVSASVHKHHLVAVPQPCRWRTDRPSVFVVPAKQPACLAMHPAHPSPKPRRASRSYTGYIPGMSETFKKTPMMAQLETRAPGDESFIHTRTASPPKAAPARDACNFPEQFKKSEPSNLWPSLQTKAAQESFKPPQSTLALGDSRINPFVTSYTGDFSAPFEAQARLRSPMRNKDLAHTQTSLREHYASSWNRVGE